MLGTGELVVIFCVILLLFGGKRLPELARSLGTAIREFKSAFHSYDTDPIMPKPPTPKNEEIESKEDQP